MRVEVTMFKVQGKKRNAYSLVDLSIFEKTLADYWDKARTLESETINDLEKHLWLANGAAATVSIGFIQTKSTVPFWQYVGAWVFVSGILLLVIMKYVSAFNTSRDRNRFQTTKTNFETNQVTDFEFRKIRDKKFMALKFVYLVLQLGSGVAFIAGLIFTLIGIGHAI